jgi:hypothetical protein
MDWMQFPRTDDIIQYVRELTDPVDTILRGRNLAQGFIPKTSITCLLIWQPLAVAFQYSKKLTNIYT